MQVVLLFTLLVQDILLFIKRLLKTLLVLLHPIIWLLIDWFHLLLSLRHLVVLNQSLLKQLSESDALISEGLHFTIIFSVFAHLDILLKLLNMTVLIL